MNELDIEEESKLLHVKIEIEDDISNHVIETVPKKLQIKNEPTCEGDIKCEKEESISELDTEENYNQNKQLMLENIETNSKNDTTSVTLQYHINTKNKNHYEMSKDPLNIECLETQTNSNNKRIRLENVYECDKCEKSFCEPGHLREHKHLRHNPNNVNINFLKDGKKVTKVFPLSKPIEIQKCKNCGEFFHDTGSLLRHIKDIHKECVCRICKTVCTDVVSLFEHENQHLPKKPKTIYKCAKCGKITENFQKHKEECFFNIKHESIDNDPLNVESDLRRNTLISVVNMPQQRFKNQTCKICNKTFPDLQIHFETVHFHKFKISRGNKIVGKCSPY